MHFPSVGVAQVPAAFTLFITAVGFSHCAGAQAGNTPAVAIASPVGRWKTIADATGKVKSIVDLREESGKLYGTIETLFDPPVPHPTCYLCNGAMKDEPLVGLQVLWGFHADGGSGPGARFSILKRGGSIAPRLHSKTEERNSGCMDTSAFRYSAAPSIGCVWNKKLLAFSR